MNYRLPNENITVFMEHLEPWGLSVVSMVPDGQKHLIITMSGEIEPIELNHLELEVV
jgi:hypothetical protein